MVGRKFSSLLASLRGLHLHLNCQCGYTRAIPIDTLYDRHPSLRLCDVLPKLSCSACGKRGGHDVTIGVVNEAVNPMALAGFHRFEEEEG